MHRTTKIAATANSSPVRGFFGLLPASSIAGAPPAIASIDAPSVLSAGERGAWRISAADPASGGAGGLLYAAKWGDEGFFALFAPPAFTATSTLWHAYERPGAYGVTVYVRSRSGQTTKARVGVIVLPSEARAGHGPAISGVRIILSDATSAPAVAWNTDATGDSRAWVSPTPALRAGQQPMVIDPGQGTGHVLVLDGLPPYADSYVVIGSEDPLGRLSTSSPFLVHPLSTSTADLMWERL